MVNNKNFKVAKTDILVDIPVITMLLFINVLRKHRIYIQWKKVKSVKVLGKLRHFAFVCKLIQLLFEADFCQL